MSRPSAPGPTPHADTAASPEPAQDLPLPPGTGADEPIWPKPQPFTGNWLKRLAGGLGSWLGLLNEWDFRIGIGSSRFAGLELVLVNQPQLVRQVLVEEPEAFPKHPYTQWILEPLIGQGIFAVNGPQWQRQRRLLDQALQTAQLRRVFPLMEGAVAAMLERFEGQLAAQGQGPDTAPAELRFDAQEAMTLVTADVIVRTILSRPLDAHEARQIFAAFARYQRRAGLVMLLRFLRLPKPWLQRLLLSDAALIRNWIAALIDQRQRFNLAPTSETPNSDNPLSETPKNEGPQDLLDALERAVDRTDPTVNDPTVTSGTEGNSMPKSAESGSHFSATELIDQVCVLFLAGHETSASALAMACYLLARYPEAQTRFAQEIQQVLVNNSSPETNGGLQRPLGYDDLRRLPYGNALLQETLRLYPPLSFFIRESQAPSQLGESRCPMGALLAISPWVIQRHEQHWSHANSFQPERFLSDQATEQDKQWARDAYLPFGLGPRKCPGAAFALQEALLVLAELVSRYELLSEPEREPELVGNLTLRSRNGVHLRLRRRQSP